jgi:hypothetical protein
MAVRITNRDIVVATGGCVAGIGIMAVLVNDLFKKQEKQIEYVQGLCRANHDAVLKFIEVTPPSVSIPIAQQVLTDYEFQNIIKEEK